MSRSSLPIGVFDSGVGGLTVFQELSQQLPGESLTYLGDTARVPYGTRSAETVVRYSERVAGRLVCTGVKALVVACNTASTWALPVLEARGTELGIPVIGVIVPGVEQALEATRNGQIAVIGTEGTIRGGEYERQLHRRAPEVCVTSFACPLFVALAEEGWTHGEVAQVVVQRYLTPLQDGPDTLILGCTHYPLLADTIQRVLPAVRLVDSARATASTVGAVLDQHQLRAPSTMSPTRRFLVTDNLDRFHRVGERFLGRAPEPVELVDLDDDDERSWTSNLIELSPRARTDR